METLVFDKASNRQHVSTRLDAHGREIRIELLLEQGSAGETTALIRGGFVTRYQAAGDGFEYPWGVWASYTHSRFEDEFAATSIDADSDLLLVGADFSPWDNYVFGVALGYDNTEVDTNFNAGEQDLDAYSIVPYMGVNLSEALDTAVDLNVSIDMLAGFSAVDIDQFRINAAGTRVTSTTTSDRFFWAANVNVEKQLGDLYLSGRAGLLYAVDESDQFQDSAGNLVGTIRTELGRVSAGGLSPTSGITSSPTSTPRIATITNLQKARQPITPTTTMTY